MLEQTFSTREVAKILGIPSPSLDKAVYFEKCDKPEKDSSNRFRWTRLDIHRAAWQLSRQKNFETWLADNPPPTPPPEKAESITRRSVLA